MMNTRSPTRWEGIAPGPGGGAGAGASDGAGRRRKRCGFTGLGRGSVGVLVYWLFVQHKARPVLRVSRSQESRGLESWQRVCRQMTGKQGKGQSGLESDT